MAECSMHWWLQIWMHASREQFCGSLNIHLVLCMGGSSGGSPPSWPCPQLFSQLVSQKLECTWCLPNVCPPIPSPLPPTPSRKNLAPTTVLCLPDEAGMNDLEDEWINQHLASGSIFLNIKTRRSRYSRTRKQLLTPARGVPPTLWPPRKRD